MTKRSETSYRILQSAREEFKAKGYEQASVRDIAQRAGYTTGVLYSRYKDKEELFSAVVKFGEMAMEDKIAKVISTNVERSQSDFLQGKDFSITLRSGRNDIGKFGRNEVVNRLLSIIDVIYTYKDTFALLIRCSKGSSKENYIEDFADKESVLQSYIFDRFTSQGNSDNSILSLLSHNLAVAIYRTLFNSALDLPKEDVVKFIENSLAD